MGRGRAKAKQTKVARDLKYRTIDTDFSQLQRELHGDEAEGGSVESVDEAADYSYGGEFGYDDSESAAH